MNFKLGFMIVALTALSGVASATTYPLGEQDPNGTFTQAGFSDTGRGWEFLANPSGIAVTQLGMNDYGSGTYEVDLFDVATQTELASSIFNYTTGGPNNGWVFQDITPVPLTAGNAYIVELYTEANSTYYFDVTPPANWLPTGDIQYVNMLFCNGCGPGTYPTLDFVPGSMYGIPDIGYVTGLQETPEPASLAVLGVSLAGLGFVRRRKRA